MDKLDLKDGILPVGEFDIDVGNGLSELITDCLFAEFPKMNHDFLNINDLSEKSQKKLNFYFDFLEKKRDAGLEIKTNPYCIFPQKKYMLHLKERQDLINHHVDKVKNWFYVCHKKGFDPNIPDSTGLTPVHYAIKFSNMPLLECLSDLGADLFPRYLRENIKDYAFSHQMYDYIPWATMKTEKRSLQTLPVATKTPRFKKI